MPTIPNWIKTAFEEIGQKEQPDPGENPRIAEYLATVLQPADDEIAWCSAFVNWVMYQSGYLVTRSAAARSWLKWGTSLPSAKFGCIVVFQRGMEVWQGHVAFYLDGYDGFIYALGGNQGDRVSIARYSENKVLGYRWPGD